MSTCRMWLQANGMAYPKSSCGKCGSLLTAGWKCAEGRSDPSVEVRPVGMMQSPGLPSMGSGDRFAVVYENGSLLVMADGLPLDAALFQKNAAQNARVARVKILSAVEVTEEDVERDRLRQKIKETRATLAALEQQVKDLG